MEIKNTVSLTVNKKRMKYLEINKGRDRLIQWKLQSIAVGN